MVKVEIGKQTLYMKLPEPTRKFDGRTTHTLLYNAGYRQGIKDLADKLGIIVEDINENA